MDVNPKSPDGDPLPWTDTQQPLWELWDHRAVIQAGSGVLGQPHVPVPLFPHGGVLWNILLWQGTSSSFWVTSHIKWELWKAKKWILTLSCP